MSSTVVCASRRLSGWRKSDASLRSNDAQTWSNTQHWDCCWWLSIITTHAGKEAVEDVKQETGGDVEMLILDVTSEESIKGVVEAVQEK